MFEEELKDLREEIHKIAREEHGTVEAMCWHLGLNKATMSYLLNSKRNFQLGTIAKVCEALGLTFKISIERKTNNPS